MIGLLRMHACVCNASAGEEQSKVEVLCSRLADLGEDVDALLATVAVQEEQQDGAEELL